MTRDELLEAFGNLNIWKRRAERAPHKPLLVLYALGRLRQFGTNWISFTEVDKEFRKLLEAFGPRRKSHHPEYPFWRLQNDGVWSAQAHGSLETRKGHSDAKKSELIAKEATGGFTEAVLELFESEPGLIREVANRLLEGHFPDSIHSNILEAVGLDLTFSVEVRERRAPEFRGLVLAAYGNRCAVCGMDLRLQDQPIALEAAHIKWRQAGGPDIVPNGLAMCVLHHKTFDLGALGIDTALKIVVSDGVGGSEGLDHILWRHRGKPVRIPERAEDKPRVDFLDWHRKQVFKGNAERP